jgi:hypothetical protein
MAGEYPPSSTSLTPKKTSMAWSGESQVLTNSSLPFSSLPASSLSTSYFFINNDNGYGV